MQWEKSINSSSSDFKANRLASCVCFCFDFFRHTHVHMYACTHSKHKVSNRFQSVLSFRPTHPAALPLPLKYLSGHNIWMFFNPDVFM